MSDITFPKVIVCPPRDTYTNLNFDLMKAENITLDDDTRKIFSDYAFDVVQELFFSKAKDELEKVQGFSTGIMDIQILIFLEFTVTMVLKRKTRIIM